MNWDVIEGRWKELKGDLRTKWAKLTDSDFEAIGGKKDKLAGRIQQAYGYGKEEAERDIDTWISQVGPSDRERANRAS
jgi:uncharacterized protein YjbJ (UPF0337 family)